MTSLSDAQPKEAGRDQKNRCPDHHIGFSMMHHRALFADNMAKIELGAKVARSRFVWTIVKVKKWKTSVDLTLRCGHHTIKVPVGMCHSGPCLWQTGIRSVAPGPSQREMAL